MKSFKLGITSLKIIFNDIHDNYVESVRIGNVLDDRVKLCYDNDNQTAEAPEIISHNSMVILACRALLYSKVNFSRISPAFLEAFSMAFILELCSLAVLFKKAL